MAIGEPRRVPNEDIRLGAGLGEREGSCEIADVVAPDVVAACVVEAAELLEDQPDGCAIFGRHLVAPEQAGDVRDLRGLR